MCRAAATFSDPPESRAEALAAHRPTPPCICMHRTWPHSVASAPHPPPPVNGQDGHSSHEEEEARRGDRSVTLGPTSSPLSLHASRQSSSGSRPLSPQTPLRSRGALQHSLLSVPHWIPSAGPVTFTPVLVFSLFVPHNHLLTGLSGSSPSIEGGVFSPMPVPAIGTLDHSLVQEEHHGNAPGTGAASQRHDIPFLFVLTS